MSSVFDTFGNVINIINEVITYYLHSVLNSKNSIKGVFENRFFERLNGIDISINEQS